jgi:DNA-binding XRE family transcriptional regulator
MGPETSTPTVCPAERSAPSRVAELRLTLEKSREQLGRDAGLSARTIYNIEHGATGEPREITKRALARALDCATEDIFPDDSAEYDGSPAGEAGLPKRSAATGRRTTITTARTGRDVSSV